MASSKSNSTTSTSPHFPLPCALPFIPIASRVHELTPFPALFPGVLYVPLTPTLLTPPSVIAYLFLCFCRHSDTNHLFTYTRYYYCYLTLFLFRL